jgi:hypothetical protein
MKCEQGPQVMGRRNEAAVGQCDLQRTEDTRTVQTRFSVATTTTMSPPAHGGHAGPGTIVPATATSQELQVAADYQPRALHAHGTLGFRSGSLPMRTREMCLSRCRPDMPSGGLFWRVPSTAATSSALTAHLPRGSAPRKRWVGGGI